MVFHFYGLILAISIIISFLLFCYLVSRDPILSKITSSTWQTAFIITLISGLIGARLYHILDFWSFYSQQPIEIVKIWNGGLGILGAIIFGGGGLIVFSRWKKLPALKIFDFLAPCLALGQVIGRWANFFNQEIYGYPTELEWGIFIDKVNRLPGFENYQFFHPLFLYEILGSLVIFVILLGIWYRKNAKEAKTQKVSGIISHFSFLTSHFSFVIDGFIFFLYLILYGVLRFFLEGMRIRGWEIGGVNVTQVVAVVFILFGMGGIVVKIFNSQFSRLNE